MPPRNLLLNSLTENQVLGILLGTQVLNVPGGTLHSVVVSLIKDIRSIGGRNITTGQKLTGQRNDFWMACLGYLIFLEQVGKLFRLKTGRTIKGSEIERALWIFKKMPKKTRVAFFALRCALAHGYNLTNPNERQESKHHRFELNADPSKRLILLRTKIWNGKPDSRDKRTFTKINVVKFGDLAEDIFQILRREYSIGNLKLRAKLNPKNAFLTYVTMVR